MSSWITITDKDLSYLASTYDPDIDHRVAPNAVVGKFVQVFPLCPLISTPTCRHTGLSL